MAAPPPPSTPALYMTPQLKKRRDGLAPSLLDLAKVIEPQDPKTSLTRSYRTSSKFLNKSVLNSVNVDDSKELQTVIDSIREALEGMTDRDKGTKDIVSTDFEAPGCKWTLKFNPNLRANSFHLEVVCLGCSENNGNTYVVDTTLVPKKGTSDPGFKEAKASFDFVALQVRKAVVQCEFPEFPEGCKGQPFREVYQLNARVSVILFIFGLSSFFNAIVTSRTPS